MGAIDAAGLRTLADQLDEASTELDDLVRRAGRLDAAGAMWRVPLVVDWQQGHAARLRTSARIAEDLEAQHVDWTTTLRLFGLPADLASLPPDAGPAALTGLEQVLDALPDEADAAERSDAVAAFFEQLSPLEQAWLVTSASQTVGNLDGVPNSVRYAANRLTIERTLADEQARYDDWQPPPGPSEAAYVGYSLLAERIERYEEFLHIEPLPGRGSNGERVTREVARSFLMFSPPVWEGTRVTDDGRIAEVIGDLDTASHIGVMVPGITTRIDNFDAMADNAKALREASATPGSTAVVAWLGYDTPEFEEAVATTRAEQGGAALVGTVEGMRRSAASEVTVLGHSYGSVVTSQALQSGLLPDRVVLFGSPGLGHDIRSTADLGLPPDYPIYALRAPGDWVSYSEGHGRDPVDLPGVTRLDTGWDGTVEATGHSQYYEAHTGALANLADVLSGKIPSHLGGDGIVEEQHGALTVRRLMNVLPAIVPPDQQYALLGDLEPLIHQMQHGEVTPVHIAQLLAVLDAHGIDDRAPVIVHVVLAGLAEEASRLATGTALDEASSLLGDAASGTGVFVDGAQRLAGHVVAGAQGLSAWLVDGGQDLTGRLADGAQGLTSDAVDLGQEGATIVGDLLGDVTGWAVDGAQDLTRGLVDGVEDGGGALLDGGQSLLDRLPLGPLSGARDALNDGLDAAQAGSRGLMDAVQSITDGAVDSAQDAVGDIAGRARAWADDVVDVTQDVVGGAFDAGQAVAGDAVDHLQDAGRDAIDAVRETIDGAVDRAQDQAADTVDDVRRRLEDAADDALGGRWPF